MDLKDHEPHGTIAELEGIHANLAVIGACTKRVKEDGQVIIAGCGEYRRCTLPEKSGSGPKTSGYKGAGPCGKGVEFFKQSPAGMKPNAPGTRRIVGRLSLWCWHIPGFAGRIEGGGGLVRVVASEGETIRVRGTDAKDQTIPGQGLVRVHEDVIRDEVVPRFPRPGQEWNLREGQLFAEAVEAETLRRRAALPGQMLGMKEEDREQDSTPVDLGT